MIYIKKPEEIKIMRKSGKILGEVLAQVVSFVRPGVTELELDSLAEKLILKKGGRPGFKLVPGYKHTICVSVNEVVVHGIPTNRVLKQGDIIGIDCGVYFEGFHTDMAETIRVKNSEFGTQSSDKEIDNFLAVGKKAMFDAIKHAKPGSRVGEISKAMQEGIEGGGFSVVRSLVGHGVGKELHEEPEVPGYLQGKISSTPMLVSNMTIAIEAIYNMGKKEVAYGRKDDWTIVSKDNSLSGLFERTVVITEQGFDLLTFFSSDKDFLS